MDRIEKDTLRKPTLPQILLILLILSSSSTDDC
jgi:hypothetical protein